MRKTALLLGLFATTSLALYGAIGPAAPATPSAPPASTAPAAATSAAPSPATPAAPQEPTIPDDATRVAVLGYHDFAENMPETAMRMHTSKFRKQMETIRQLGITVITKEDFDAWRKGEKQLPEKCILITLDDGWKSVYTDAFPILKEFHYPFTLYLYKNYIDGGGKAQSSAMIQEMMKSGASLGSHSVTHPYPATIKGMRKKGPELYDAFLRKEMGESKQFLESKFGVKINSYAYPGGFYTEEMLPLSKEFGYDHLFTVIPGKVKRSSPGQTLPRYMILGNVDRIFELATNFIETQASPSTPTSPVEGTAAMQSAPTTPLPVTPEAGSIVNTRMPEISVDFSSVPNVDPKTLIMKVSGFGEVPATYVKETQKFTWQVNRRLRQPACQISVSWKDTTGKPAETPLRWSFQIDREAAYMPDSE